MKNKLKAVELFHKTFGAPVANEPTTELDNSKSSVNLVKQRETLRFDLMREENEEYLEAVHENNLVGIADALGDMLYILCGTIVEHGLQNKIDEVFDEIQRSNMSKLGEDGKPIYREDGKVLKGPNYFKPNIEKILFKKEEPKKKFISIAAISGNEVIAKDGKIPWNLPNDFKRFKEVTSGHHIIMGRKTFESLPGLLPNRTHVVITRNKEYTVAGNLGSSRVVVVNSLKEAVELCPQGTSYIIGGGEIYKEAMCLVDELDLTIVDINVTGDNLTKFPPAIECMGQFRLVSKTDHKKDEKHEFDYSFVKLVRK